MASLQQIKRRIKSIESTAKITRAMQMISVAKLRQAVDGLNPARNYDDSIDQIVELLLRGEFYPDVMVQALKPKEKTLICLVMSDTGLCGAYNTHIAKAFDQYVQTLKQKSFDVIAVGAKAVSFCNRKKIPIVKAVVGLHGRFSLEAGQQISEFMVREFIAGTYNQVIGLFSKFESIARHAPINKSILPIPKPANKGAGYLLTEPTAEKIIKQMFPQYVLAKINILLLEAFASEHASRMISMQTATDNAAEILENLVLTRNKVRQAGITREMIELISSSESLKE